MACQSRSIRRRTSASSASMLSSFARSSRAAPSISLSTGRTRSRMLDSVRMYSRIWSMVSRSKRFALRRGVSQVPLPRFSRDWQT